MEEGDLLASVLAVDPKVTVQREDESVVMQLRHPHQASVGQGHRHALVAAEQLPDGAKLGDEAEVRDDQSALQKLQQTVGATMRPLQEEEGFAQRRIASQQRADESPKHIKRPGVVFVVALKVSHQRPRIRNYRFHEP